MSTTASPSSLKSATTKPRLRNIAIGGLFAVILLVPRFLYLRRNEGSWTAFRILLGIAGAALVILPLSLWNSWVAGIVGLAMFLAAILLPPAKPDHDIDLKARELGALVVINGGRYQPGNAPAAQVQLFVGSEHVWALDSHLQPLLVVPVAEISSARAEQIDRRWTLRVRWADRTAEFAYRGAFAEHLARVAESTVGSVMRPALPVLPQRRAAGA